MAALFEQDNSVKTPVRSNEWYTPSRYIEAASCELANRVVKAKKYYSIEDNGLTQDWNGNVWLNPPYGKVNPIPGSTKSYQKIFVQRLLHEYNQGNIEQAILLLLGNSCFAHYFYPLWKYPLCFHDGYISFYRSDGSTSDFGFGTILVYLGPNETRFIKIFSQFGRIAKAIDVPQARPTTLPLWDTDERGINGGR